MTLTSSGQFDFTILPVIGLFSYLTITNVTQVLKPGRLYTNIRYKEE